LARIGDFREYSLMIDNVLYVTTAYNQVAALNADTGAQLWRFDPKSYVDGQPTNGMGFSHAALRLGVMAGTSVYSDTRYRLICLDAHTGQLSNPLGKME